ncbi:MAG: tRNA pseudouridine synthase B [Candidatus Phytoplasma cynodontis]|uniref:tRNA pseudouridine(55) synthase TruB n=1 Tax='Cynodon dactylon' phytoplasma TaxID=295320 RepID=UPI001265D38C|nr:tRNA pseudouridine(55) synthase TruB ['Cynodon dactylon' phytoplasma]KAB8122014.1 tRNA pseudouridine(55) synthase TruB ['Cynodon dactylon' phytoplasma]WIA07570.1 MAG: tRNA pseudouridine synthase B [Candidatus Phytoplasma cynodontis]
MNGFFLVYKKKGITSHDTIRQIKKKFNLKKVGHTGTLDPFAEGLLIVLVNNFTKLSFLFEKLHKSYEGIMVFNKNYDTLDITGKLINENFDIILNLDMIQKSFNFFHQKKYLQIPPMYSAVKIRGQKMYNLARKGIKIDIPPKEVHIYELKILSFFLKNQVYFYSKVSKGTYIRSLVRDIAAQMNTYGFLKKLVRVCIGEYCLKKSKCLFTISKEDLIDEKEFFKNCLKIILSSYLIKLVRNGIYLDYRQIKTYKPFIVLDENYKWIAYYEPIKNNKYHYCPKFFF